MTISDQTLIHILCVLFLSYLSTVSPRCHLCVWLFFSFCLVRGAKMALLMLTVANVCFNISPPFSNIRPQSFQTQHLNLRQLKLKGAFMLISGPLFLFLYYVSNNKPFQARFFYDWPPFPTKRRFEEHVGGASFLVARVLCLK